MSRLGYLETQGSTKRLRFVQNGYDADDEDVPSNKVIFDSNDIGTLSLLQSGEKTWTGIAYNDAINETIVTWDYDFVPLCALQFYSSAFNGKAGTNAWLNRIDTSVAQNDSPMFRVSKTGILVKFKIGYAVSTAKLRWWAFRMAAA